MLSESEAIDIYSAGGMLIKSNAGKDFISTLPKGIYVLKAKGKSITILK